MTSVSFSYESRSENPVVTLNVSELPEYEPFTDDWLVSAAWFAVNLLETEAQSPTSQSPNVAVVFSDSVALKEVVNPVVVLFVWLVLLLNVYPPLRPSGTAVTLKGLGTAPGLPSTGTIASTCIGGAARISVACWRLLTVMIPGGPTRSERPWRSATASVDWKTLPPVPDTAGEKFKFEVCEIWNVSGATSKIRSAMVFWQSVKGMATCRLGLTMVAGGGVPGLACWWSKLPTAMSLAHSFATAPA